MFAASPSWAVGGEGGSAVRVSGGAAATMVTGVSGLIYGGQGVSAGRAAYDSGYAPVAAGQGKVAVGERSMPDETDGGLAQILTSLALVFVLVGKRISG